MKLMDEVKLQSSVDALSALCVAFKDDPRWPEIRQNLLALREVLRDRAAEPPDAEACDKAAAQAMDRIAAAKNMHALDLNPDVTAHHTLRRELIRAGYALALGVAVGEAPSENKNCHNCKYSAVPDDSAPCRHCAYFEKWTHADGVVVEGGSDAPTA